MPRPKKKRRVNYPPKMLGFRPFGMRLCDTEPVVMQYEEYEAVKLVVYDDLSQDKAAEKMEVSRPTLTRIYNSALKKIGQAFVEGRTVLIKGGHFSFDEAWYKCNTCFKLMASIDDTVKCDDCLIGNSEEIMSLNE
ncbi:DUF134 domain-containing protein [Tamlana haliotis]|uniref:UPF0251 protein F6U93_03850 n=1 Tax=Pseudotamlana haliotis TaxID=2614804 RepID=A0A6N6MF62_9FLAO|nr:DUF134 domain-containing protein [Tamlana haliotis]KAB1069456.1 DUF134 domain-containing protein [Tamlana haliotis]